MKLSRRQILTSLSGLAIGAGAVPFGARASTTLCDARILRSALETLHPGLYRYQSPREWAQRFERFESRFERAGRLEEKYLHLSALLAHIRCGHTYANFFNQRDEVAERLFDRPTRLPFRFRWLGRRMIVTDGQQSGLPAGAEIIRINGVAASSILSSLLPLVRADGGNDDKRRSLLGVQGRQRIETFDVYHALRFPPDGAEARIEALLPSGEHRQVRLRTVGLGERQASLAAPTDRAANPGWTLDFTGEAAVMTMNDWAMYSSRWDWRGWIASSFEEMARRQTRALILDLRANEGGNDVGDEILARLIDRPVARSRWQRRVRFRTAPESLRPYLDTWDRSFDRLGEGAADLGNGFYALAEEGSDRVIAPAAPNLPARLIVLVGPENSSATFQFASLVRRARLGMLIGEPTGGNRRGINGGAYYFLRLPESGLEADIPLIGYFPPEPQPDAGIRPDLMTPTSAEDIARSYDRTLETALRIARNPVTTVHQR